MLRQWRVLWALVLLCALFNGTAFADESDTARPSLQSPSRLDAFNNQLNPAYTVASYYNAINLKDYARAYSYWRGNVPNQASLTTFAQGFANVKHVQTLVRLPLASDGTAGIIYVPVPVALNVTLNDNSHEIYLGCINTYQLQVPVNNAPEADPNWYLWSASLKLAKVIDFSLAVEECYRVDSFPTEYNAPSLIDPIATLTAYYDSIARKDYARAYSYWNANVPNNATLEQFSKGFANTSEIGVVIDVTTIQIQGAAGSAYASLPMMLLAKESGKSQFFVGCYTARQSNVPVGNNTVPDPNWYLYRINLKSVSSASLAIQQIGQQDCL